MKQTLILLISIILFSCKTEELKRYSVGEVSFPNDSLFYLKSDSSLLNGIVYSQFGDLGKVIKGVKEGKHKRWYENGQLKEVSNWKGGKRGKAKYWYENGQLNYETYLDGELEYSDVYSTKTYYENGNLMIYIKNQNDSMSIVKWYHKNGNLWYDYDTQFDLEKNTTRYFSYWKNYDENGYLNYHYIYEKGKRIEIKEYDKGRLDYHKKNGKVVFEYGDYLDN